MTHLEQNAQALLDELRKREGDVARTEADLGVLVLNIIVAGDPAAFESLLDVLGPRNSVFNALDRKSDLMGLARKGLEALIEKLMKPIFLKLQKQEDAEMVAWQKKLDDLRADTNKLAAGRNPEEDILH